MQRRVRALVPAATVAVSLVLASVARAEPGVEVLRSDRSGVIVRLSFDAPYETRITGDGGEWLHLAIDDLGADALPGWPQLPGYTALIGVPPDVAVRDVIAVPEAVQRRDGPPVMPVPTPVPHPDGGARTSGERLAPAWSDDAPHTPARWAELETVSWWRNRRVAVVRVHPVRTRPGERGYEMAREITLSLVFAPGREPSRKPLVAPYGADPMDATIDRRLVNGPESREWLRSERPRAVGRAGARRGSANYFSSAPTWVKIRSRGEGILRVTGAQLQAAGVAMPITDAASIRVFTGPARELGFDMPTSFDTWLREVAIRVEDGGDGVLNATSGDRVELFAQPVDGFAHELDPTDPDTTYTMHQYTSERVYWLAWGNGFAGDAPLRMSVEPAPPDGASVTPVSSLTERVHIEENGWFEGAFKHPQLGPVGIGRWQKDEWEKWWWNTGYSIADNSARFVDLRVPPHVAGSAGRVLVRLHGATLGAHRVRLTLNGEAIPLQAWSGRNRQDVLLDAAVTPGYIAGGNNRLTLFVDPNEPPARPEDKVHLAFVEVWHERLLAWDGRAFTFRAPALDATVRYTVSALPNGSAEVYDITDPLRPVLLVDGATAGGANTTTLTFDRDETAAAPRRYLVSHPSVLRTPFSVEVDEAPGPSYLKETAEPVDYLVVYADPFATAAEALRSFRDGYLPGADDPRAMAVKVSDIYDEFSGGMPDPSAIRQFLRFAYETYRDPAAPASPRLRFATLLGDADFDHRNFVTQSAVDWIPAWSERFDTGLVGLEFEPSWPSDDYFGLLEDPQDILMWIAVGRLPAASVGQANAMVSKTIEHATASDRSPWFHRALFSADDLCQGTDWDEVFYIRWEHTRQCEEELLPELPDAIDPVKVYLVDYPDPVRGITCIGTTKPSARDAFIGAINDGVFMLDYVGHGGETVMADERVLESSDVPAMTNRGRYHYFITASCTVGKFDDIAEGLGETVMKHAGGGAVNSVSAAAVAYSGSNIIFNRELLAALFKGRTAHPDSIRTFGEAFVLSKSRVTGASINNTRKYNVMGDPANVIPWTDHVVDAAIVESVPPREPAEGTAKVAAAHVRPALARAALTTRGAATNDTLWRGEVTTIDAQVLGHGGAPVPGYTGLARLEVYDSKELRHRDPYTVIDGGSEQLVTPVDYYLPGAPIYRAEVPVVNGAFTSTFFVPTGLRRGERGAARIMCHIVGDDGADAFGTIESVTIPDNTRYGDPDDDTPPVIEVDLDGPAQAIPVQSTLRIRLQDDSGIYITQLLDSRSAVLTFEDAGGFVVSLVDLSPRIVFGDDYRSTEVEVPIPTSLEVGRPYLMKVRASDNVGNRTTLEQEVYFVVSDTPEVQRVFAYPNPTDGRTAFFVDVNVAVDVKVEIYTVTGRRIRTLDGRLAAGEGRTRPLPWDLRDEDGDKIANGSYLYVMTVTPSDGGPVEERQGWIAVLR